MNEAAAAEPTPARHTANETVASNIRAELALGNLKPADLARALGENDMWLSRRMSSKVAFSTDEVQQIADLLGVEVGTLFQRRSRATAGALGRRHLYLMDSAPEQLRPPTDLKHSTIAPITGIFERRGRLNSREKSAR